MKQALMKKIKYCSFVILILGLLLMLVSILAPIIKFNNYAQQNGSIGIIGGAGAPTALFIIRYIYGGWMLYTLMLGAILFLSGVFCLIFNRTVANNCTLKTTALALIISFFGASGLACLLNWYFIVAFQEMSEHPVSYPLSIVGGLISLLAFIIFIVFYIKARKENVKVKGIIIDILTSIITLPIFICIDIYVYNLLSSMF